MSGLASTSKKSGKDRLFEAAAEMMLEPAPAPGSGFWESTPISLPDVWAYKTGPWQSMTISAAIDFGGSTNGRYPMERLARYLERTGYAPDTQVAWSRGKGCGLTVARVGGREYRDIDGLIFDRYLEDVA